MPSPPVGGYYLEVGSQPQKHPRNTSHTLTRQQSFPDYHFTWTADNQDRLGVILARLTASCGFPYRWVENPEWATFLTEFFPLAKHISRRQLSDTLIPREVAIYCEKVKASCMNTLTTIQCDGWSGINFHHFLAFMITMSKWEVSFNFVYLLNNQDTNIIKVHTVRVFDTSAERKTAENLLGEIQQVITLLCDEWKVTVVAITSDAAREAKKACCLLLQSEPSLIVPDYWAHQVKHCFHRHLFNRCVLIF